MKVQISEKILNETTRCRKNYICLTEMDSLCEIKYCLNGKSFIIKPEKNRQCAYMVSTGNIVLCSCPTRKEIYKKLRKCV